jgi:hypothetical protein
LGIYLALDPVHDITPEDLYKRFFGIICQPLDKGQKSNLTLGQFFSLFLSLANWKQDFFYLRDKKL